VTFYPKGNHASTSSKSSIFVFLSKPDNPEINGAEPLKMVCELRCGVRRSRYFGNIAKFEPNGLGYQNFNTLDDLQKNPMITISATMHYNYSCIVPTNHDFLADCTEMHYSTYSEGDIMLRVMKHTDSSLAEDVDDEPPAKKRKLNHPTASKKNKNTKVEPRRSKRLQNKNCLLKPSVVNVDTSSLSEEEGDESESSEESSDSSSSDEVSACSIVLKASSPVFKRMLESNMQESQKKKKITICADSVDAVHDMLYFMWTNEFPVHERNNMLSLIKLAHYYECERLKIACINQIIRELSVDNFVDVVNTLNQYSIEEGTSAVIEFASKNRNKIVADDRCNELPFMFKMSVLKMCK